MKHSLSIGLISAVITAIVGMNSVIAAPPPGVAATPAQPSKRTASNVLEEAIERLNQFVASGKAQNPAEMARFVEQHVKPFFDFERMAKLIAGPILAQLNDQQRALFIQRVKAKFLSAFVQNVVSHRGPPPLVQFLPPRPSADATRIDLPARLLFPDGSTRRLVFRFAKSGDKWRAFDVSAGGSSAVLYYRKHYMNLARRGGIPALLGG